VRFWRRVSSIVYSVTGPSNNVLGFEESALVRLRRYREEADLSLEVQRGIEETTRHFSERPFAGLEYVAGLGRRAGFGMEAEVPGACSFCG
jgi:hypothetical protein